VNCQDDPRLLRHGSLVSALPRMQALASCLLLRWTAQPEFEFDLFDQKQETPRFMG
jgi:hypothetical protein